MSVSEELEILEAQAAKLTATIKALKEEALKPKKFEFKYCLGSAYKLGLNSYTFFNKGDEVDWIESGSYRLTKEAAEQSLERNRKANRLEALAEQLGGLGDFDDAHYRCYIQMDYEKYQYDISSFDPIIGVVYMTEECATEICRMLNEGEFVL